MQSCLSCPALSFPPLISAVKFFQIFLRPSAKLSSVISESEYAATGESNESPNRAWRQYRKTKNIMKTIILRNLAVCFIASLCVSCATQKLWENTQAGGRIFIPENQIAEAELKRRGVEYEKVVGGVTESPAGDFREVRTGGYLVKKTAARKFRDYVFRALGTPVTATIDAACTVSVVGSIVTYERPDLVLEPLADVLNN